LTFKLQNEHQQIGFNRVNFKEKAIYIPQNMQIGNLHGNGKNKPFYSWFISTDPNFSGYQNLNIE
jgi:hypothetical protein